MCYAIIGQYTSFSAGINAPTSIDVWVLNRWSNEKRLGGGIELWTFELNEEVQKYLCITREKMFSPNLQQNWRPCMEAHMTEGEVYTEVNKWLDAGYRKENQS